MSSCPPGKISVRSHCRKGRAKKAKTTGTGGGKKRKAAYIARAKKRSKTKHEVVNLRKRLAEEPIFSSNKKRKRV